MPECEHFFGVELKKATLLGHLFADFHYVLEKKEKVSVQLTLSIWWISTLSACVAQAVSVFTAVKIRTDEPGVEPQTVFFFHFSFCQKQTENQHVKAL